MLKLARNYFAARALQIKDQKKFIKWKFIQNLHLKQEQEELHCACKVRRRHVYFHREKMKVFLAAQTLSSSVAKALEFLDHKIEDPNFAYSGTTSEFCQNINDIFDLLNSKNKFCKTPSRKPITKNNLADLDKKVEKFVKYIENLETEVPKTKKYEKKERWKRKFTMQLWQKKSQEM